MNNTSPTLLAVLAHPDDETFGMGGTLALYSRRGTAVHLVCATRGEVGEMDARLMKGYNFIGERREYELQCAVKHLNLKALHFLDYRDSGMPGAPDNEHPKALTAAPLEEVIRQITRSIRMLRPQVVLTFDPIGGYWHPDHITIHQATTAAFFAAGNPEKYPDDLPPHQPQKLYFHMISRTGLKLAIRILRLLGRDPQRFGQNQDMDITSLAELDFPRHATIDYRPVRRMLKKATSCHVSQGGEKMSRNLLWQIEQILHPKEHFMQAYPKPETGLIASDLFEGVIL